MLRVDLRTARPGMSLALPVMNPKLPGHELLRVGYTLTPSVIEKLDDMRVRSVWVDYPALSFLDKFIDRDAVEKQSHVVTQIQSTFELLQHQSAAKLPYDTYTDAIGALVDQLISNPGAALFLGDMIEFDDDSSLMQSGSTVTYLSLLLGLKLEGYLVKQRPHCEPTRARDVLSLGVGAMLHDIGVTMLPPEVRTRYEQTGDERDPAWREHAALGFRAVRGRIEPTAANVVLHHHQQFDGNGYAGKDFPAQAGTSIHIFARIASVAEMFNRLRHPRSLVAPPTVQVLAALLSDQLAPRFDPNVLRALVDVVPPYPPGSMVTLTTGRKAVVINPNVKNPCRPTVQLLPGDGLPDSEGSLGPSIDLSEQLADLAIIACNDQPTAAYNFSPDLLPGNSMAVNGW
ncbi:MAG: HD domain-containing phosphohydrolase [Planctomycetota bacterium]